MQPNSKIVSSIEEVIYLYCDSSRMSIKEVSDNTQYCYSELVKCIMLTEKCTEKANFREITILQIHSWIYLDNQ